MQVLRPILLLIALLCAPVLVMAQPAAPKTLSAEDRAAEAQAAWRAAVAASTKGPASIPLRDQAVLALPAGMIFIPRDPASRLERSQGGSARASLVGIVTTVSEADDWFVYVNWIAEGFVRDDEAKDIDAAAILDNLREGTEEQNKDRVARGFPELELTGWVQPPAYDTARHRLAWSLGVKSKGEAASEGAINFNTRALGREGYFSLNLVTGQDQIDKDRPVAAQLLGALEYNDGKRYADFNSATDHVAEYGLLGLLGVVAAKKLGMLALIAAFGLKFAKVGVLAVGGGLLAVRRLFKRKPSA